MKTDQRVPVHFALTAEISADNIRSMNETGRKTFFWYRVYLSILTVLYAAVAVLGVVLIVVRPEAKHYEQAEILLIGSLYAVLGTIFFIAFAIALFLPPKPYNWIVGIVLICIGMTSCCFLPICIPLLIYWFKPETQMFFGRNK